MTSARMALWIVINNLKRIETMAKKRKYTVKVKYTVYDYYTVNATSKEQAMEQALEDAQEDSLNDFMQEDEGMAVVTMVDGKSVESEKKDDEMEVLVVYDHEDGSRNNLATMKSCDWTGDKTEAMHKFLLDQYEAWLDVCDDKKRDEYLEEIKEAADLLSVGQSADCCGDSLYWETVTHI